jgi:tRNA dimethylallyltransferase
MISIKIIAGATASGKSAFALSLAEKFDGVIINADSQQVYADLRVLTARPSVEDEARAPHKLYGFLGADASCSAGIWLRYAKMEIDWARAQGKTPIVVGGTGFYLKALTQGIAEMPSVEAGVRAQAVSDFEAMGREAFAERLRAIDPEFFTRLKVQDKQRLIRAYEVWLSSGKTISWWQSRDVQPIYQPEEIEIIKIELPREELYARCNLRVEQMVEQGAIDEVKPLTTNHQSLITDFPIGKIIGFYEFASYLRGEIDLAQAIELCKTATRQYAKRQMTWFRHQL